MPKGSGFMVDNSSGKTLKGSRGVGKVPYGVKGNKATAPKGFSGRSIPPQGAADSRPENSDRNQSAK